MEKLACLKLKGKAEPLTIGFGPTKFLRETDWFYGYFLSLNNLVLLLVNMRESQRGKMHCSCSFAIRAERKRDGESAIDIRSRDQVTIWTTISQCFTPAFKKGFFVLGLGEGSELVIFFQRIDYFKNFNSSLLNLIPMANSLSSLLMLYSNSYTLIPPA